MNDIAREAAAAPVAFLSYAHHDDRRGRISRLGHELADEVQARTGEPFPIFLDHDAIGLGEPWRRRLEQGLAEVTFLIPVLSPSFFKSGYCRRELEQFLQRERDLGRDDLILPISYIDSGWLEGDSDDAVRRALREVHERQYFDWHELEPRQFSDPKVQRALRALADRIRGAIARTQRTGRGPTPLEPSIDAATDVARARAGLWQELRRAVESSLPAARQLALWTLELLTTEPDPETKAAAQEEFARAWANVPVETSGLEVNPVLAWPLPMWQKESAAYGEYHPFGKLSFGGDDSQVALQGTLERLGEFYEVRIAEQAQALDASSVGDAEQIASLQRNIDRFSAIESEITSGLADVKAMHETFRLNT